MALTDEGALSLLDDAAERLCRGFAKRGRIAYVIQDMGDGYVRVIGPDLPPNAVVSLMNRAGECYAIKSPAESYGLVN